MLFALVSILSQSFLTLVRSHLVALLFFTVWHNFKCLKIICFVLNFHHCQAHVARLAIHCSTAALRFHRIDETFGWLEAGQVVRVNRDGGVLLNVPGGLCRSVLDDKAAETSQINVFLILEKAVLYRGHEAFYHGCHFLFL